MPPTHLATAAPPGYTLRDLRTDAPAELDLVVSRSMKTVLETVPEFEGDAERARRLIPNFSHELVRAMYVRDFERPDSHRFVVAATDAGEIAGHAIYFLRTAGAEKAAPAAPSGYLFTLYVDPAHRRQRLASALMSQMVAWFEARGVGSIQAHTHVTNAPLIRLAAGYEFEIIEEREQPWPHVTLQRTSLGARAPG